MAMLTFPDQEERVVARVRSKAATFGQDMDEEGCASTAFACLLLILNHMMLLLGLMKTTVGFCTGLCSAFGK